MTKTTSLTAMAALFVFQLSGCARLSPQQEAILQQAANRPITCQAGKDCEEKWSQAVYWVKQNSAYKFRTVSDNVIQTMGPLPDDPSPAFTITKVATGNNSYALDFDGGCDNMFGCVPSLLILKASFADYIIGQPKQ